MLNDKQHTRNTDQTETLRTRVPQPSTAYLKEVDANDSQSLDSLIIKTVNENLINLPKNRLVTAKEILGEVLWDEYLPMDIHKFIGNRLSILVTQGRLPFVFAGFNSPRHNQYQVIKKHPFKPSLFCQ
ncbi:MAG: hypothetical protein JKX87_02635 [Cycloclasticus sp.]|nr:hypothetical protein [Cycloclasticus sp.]